MCPVGLTMNHIIREITTHSSPFGIKIKVWYWQHIGNTKDFFLLHIGAEFSNLNEKYMYLLYFHSFFMSWNDEKYILKNFKLDEKKSSTVLMWLLTSLCALYLHICPNFFSVQPISEVFDFECPWHSKG